VQLAKLPAGNAATAVTVYSLMVGGTGDQTRTARNPFVNGTAVTVVELGAIERSGNALNISTVGATYKSGHRRW